MIELAAAIVASVVVGVWAERRYGERARTLSERLMWAGLWVVMPIVAFANLNVLELDAKVGAGIAFGWCAVSGCILIAYLAGRYVLQLERPSIGGMMITSWGNTGFLGLPVAISLFGTEALPDAIAYDTLVHALTFVTFGFALAAAFGTVGGGMGERFKAFLFRNPPLWATAAAFLAPHDVVPSLLVDASHILVLAIVPFGFFAVGVVLATVADEGAAAFPPKMSAPIVVAVVTKCAISPAIVLALSTFVLDVPDVYVTQAAMGSGLLCLAVAQAYGLDREIVAGVIATSTAITLVWGLVVSLI